MTALNIYLTSDLADALICRPDVQLSRTCRAALWAAINPEALGAAISEAVHNVNEGEPLTGPQWAAVARSALASLIEATD